ncbi:hypothetical protein ACFFJB_01255 [Camelimonas abortus]|uniref:Uncharacterized protein n=1 Tax=Camelimonas abortus TaxID=1017184 RepID=A0ABV7LH57_9HYPH
MSYFDPEWYLKKNPDVLAAIQAGLISSAEEHFQLYGKYEGRNPSPFIDLDFYLAANPDVREAV